jgi:plasmid maintenance system antidote protein VapI
MNRAKPYRAVRNLREWLKREGWRQKDLAARLGCTESQVHYIVNGGRLTLDRAIQIKAITGLPVENLTRAAARIGK